MIRAVIDTDILVRAVIKSAGSVGPVLQRLRRRKYTLVITRATLDELVEVLNRPRLRTKYRLSEQVLRAELIRPDQRIAVCRDPHHNKFLEAAVAGRAQVIVSGDQDLVRLDPFERIPIVPPERFPAMFEAE
jgi:uncharacterized protein